MLPRLIVAVLIIALISYAINIYKSKSPETQKKLRVQYTIGGVALLLLLLTLTGRLNWIGAALAALLVAVQRLIPVVVRLLPMLSLFGKHHGIPSGIPTLRTRFLTIEVNYLTGAVNGRVTEGLYKNQLLSELDNNQINALMQQYREHDRESYRLLQAYLQYHPRGFHQQQRQQDRQSTSAMSVEEARQILGVDSRTSTEDIIAAHKKLIQKLHPDRGGSPYLAAKVNQAKDVLVGKGPKR